MNVIYAEWGETWLDIAKLLHRNYNFLPVFWISLENSNNTRNIKDTFPDCITYDVQRANRLVEIPPQIKIKKNTAHGSLIKINKEEYFCYLSLLDKFEHNNSFSFAERDRHFKSQLVFWLNVISQLDVDLVIFDEIPHVIHDYSLYLVAKSLGVPCVFTSTVPFGRWYYFSYNLDRNTYQIAFSSTAKNTPKILASFNSLVSEAKIKIANRDLERPYIIRQKKSDKNRLKFVYVFPITELYMLFNVIRKILRGSSRDLFSVKGRWRSIKDPNLSYNASTPNFWTTVRRQRQAFQYKQKLRREMSKYSVIPSLGEKYIFVPLHYQPEATTVPRGGLFADQIMLIEMLSDHLPKGWKIYVKEHYSQFTNSLWGHQGRTLDYYRQIAGIKNVSIVDINVNSSVLIDHCQAVATVSGTAGWEAIVRGKPCLTFGLAWYAPCEGSFNISSEESLKGAIEAIQNGFCPDERDVDNFLEQFHSFAFYSEYYRSNADSSPESIADAERIAQYLIDYIEQNHLLDHLKDRD